MSATQTSNFERIGENLREAGRSVWLAGLGAVASIEAEGRSAFETLVDKGKEFESRSKGSWSKTVRQTKDRVKELGGKVQETFEERVQGALEGLGVPTREDILELTRRVEDLSKKLETLAKAKDPS